MFFAAGIEKNKKDIIVSFQTILANAACKYKLQECRISEVFTEKRKL